MRIGMDHNGGLDEDEEVKRYMERDQSSNKPYKIIRNDSVGRYMVAARNIKAGEIILQEFPLSYGPSSPKEPLCLGCYSPLSRKEPHILCPGCGFPLCSTDCSKLPEHRDFECTTLQESKYRVDPESVWSGREPYNAISPLRALLLKKKDPAKWDLLWMHMSHNEARSKDPLWKKGDESIKKHLKAMMATNDDEDDMEETVQTLLGIFLVNDFEIEVSMDDGSEERRTLIRGIFALASMPNHSCVANCSHSFSKREGGFLMTMKALVDIEAGEEINHSYTEPLDPIIRRQSILRIGKFFQCNCIRCRDPTEMNTFSSALICPSCKKGHLIPRHVSEINSKWTCVCKHSLSPEAVEKITSGAKAEMEALDVSPSISSHEAFLSKYASVLHPDHVYMIDRSYVLGKMYGRMEGYEPDSLSDEQFSRKRELCERVLRVLEVLTPGRTRKKGMMMYELHLPLVITANRSLQKGPNSGVDPKEIKNNLRSGLDYLRKGLDILKEEPEGSFEHKIYVSSQESVGQLEDWVKTIDSAL
eukprot:TRINITY_DN2418_c0_g2_i1.p1 TRINITY_DN2418_c0_g2~~TRINITY_DN2418_c0_g2_i1.p1  ORF type:complete len:531 (+),score=146.39 TRINITY_DN2418_c0_g2_i1:103-1695(+)